MENQVSSTVETKTSETEKTKEGFGAKFKGLYKSIRNTATESFGGIFSTTKELVTKGAKDVKQGAKDVTKELAQTQLAQSANEKLGTAKDVTVDTTKSLLSSALNGISDVVKPTLDPEVIKLSAQVNMKKIEDLVGAQNIMYEKRQGNDQELLVGMYNQLNTLIGANENPNRAEVNKVNDNINALLKQYDEQLNKINKINPVKTNLDKLSSQGKLNEQATQQKPADVSVQASMAA